ncbi:ABC transporter ATP-binding protein [bacterium D16-51]|nr:ABC transporter ATP-binding protein [bacterium D16-59]RKI58331.1 ABC transporter ATP-binding protein [bacterium D16-51]
MNSERTVSNIKKYNEKKILFKSFFENNRLNLLSGVILVILSAVLETCLAVILQSILDAASDSDIQGLKRLFFISLVFLFSITLVELLVRNIKYSFVRRAILQYKNTIFCKLMEKNIATFYIEDTSSYVSSLTVDITSIENNYLIGIFDRISLCVKLVTSVCLMVFYNWFLFIMVVVLLAIPSVVSSLMSNGLAEMEEKVSYKNEEFMGKIRDILMGFTVIKNFKSEKEVSEKFDCEDQMLEHSKYQRRKKEADIGIVSGTLGVSVQILIFLIGAYMSIQGYISVGVVLAFVQLLNTSLNPIQQLPGMFGNRKAALALVDKMNHYLEKNTAKDKTDSILVEPLKDKVELTHLNYCYEEGKAILKNINFQFEAGKSYAVVGLSGSGKTTLLNVLLGMLNDYSGSVTYDGVDFKRIARDNLYENIAMMQQNVIIFDSTIRENITMFKKFPDENYEKAVELSGLSELIQRKGNDYVCGENGKNLSGGEKQRIAIARCLLKHYSVLLLDEATSSLDKKNTKLVMDTILGLKNITRIAVLHQMDPSILKQFDEIIVLVNGEITEKNTYESLMEEKGYFYSLQNVDVL